ncbi:MAG TPA: hypothetical protein VGB81_15615, partial [Devosia sp.]
MLIKGTVLDHETKPDVTIVVRVTDNAGNSTDETIHLSVTDAAAEARYSAQDEVSVNATIYGQQAHPSISALASGGFVATWTDQYHDGNGPEVKARIYNGDGTAAGAEFRITEYYHHGQDPTVAGLASGSFVITWSRGGFGGVEGQVFSAAGAKIGKQFVVTTTEGYQAAAEVAALASGGFVVSWTDMSATGGYTSEGAVRLQVYSASGAKVGSERIANSSTSGNQSEGVVAGLDNGGFVCVWRDGSLTGGDTSDASVKAQIFTASGAKVGGEFLVNTTTLGRQEGPAVAGTDFGFVVTWEDGPGIKAQMFTPDGVKIGSELTVRGSLARTPAVAELPGGGFIISWTEYSATGLDSEGGGIQAQMFDAAGQKVGEVFSVNQLTANSQTQADVAVLPSGAIAAIWVDDRGDPFSSQAGNIELRLLSPIQPILSGTPAADILVGTAQRDLLFGESGNDQLSGSDGHDRLDGGNGADLLKGGKGNDVFVVDNSSDAVVESEGEGADEIEASISYALGANIENLTLRGDAAINGTGNALDNKLSGNGAANVLNGGAGADTMYGGDGNDTYVVDNVQDAVMETSATGGIDTVQSSVGLTLRTNVENLMLTGTAVLNGTGNGLANVITGNSAANLLNGLAGADTMNGGGGNDTYVVD